MERCGPAINLSFILMTLCMAVVGFNEKYCLDGKTMEFNPKTYTCFYSSSRGFRNATECHRKCQRFTSGSGNNITIGHLATIFDEETNDFLKDRFTGIFWIGLARLTGNFLKWEPMTSLSKPVYQDWAKNEPDKRDYLRRVVLTRDGWKMSENPRRDTSIKCLCEAPAVFPHISVSPPPPPLRVGEKKDMQMSCFPHTTLQWRFMKWDSLSLNRYGIAECRRPKSGTKYCNSHEDGIKATISSLGSTLKIEKIQRKHEGTWKCTVYVDSGIALPTAEFNIDVYESATPIACQHQLKTDNLHVLCKTKRIYPKGVCEWKYRFNNEANKQLSNSNSKQSTDNTLVGKDLDSYYTSTCELDLNSQQDFVFKPGTLSLTVNIHPLVRGGGTRTTKELAIMIGKSVTYIKGDMVNIRCLVYHGNPQVLSITTECEFYFRTKKSEKRQISITVKNITSVVLQTHADSEMNGKSCNCSGNYLTGNTNIIELKFNILEKPRPPIFQFGNNETLGMSVNYTEGDMVNIRCLVNHGQPQELSITIVCEFYFQTEKSEKQQRSITVKNITSVVLQTHADSEMNGKSCNCSGNHLTGNTNITELKFNILDNDADDDNQDGGNMTTGTIVAIPLACLLPFCIFLLVFGIKVGNRIKRKGRQPEPPLLLTPSPEYEPYQARLPLQQAYVDVDVRQPFDDSNLYEEPDSDFPQTPTNNGVVNKFDINPEAVYSECKETPTQQFVNVIDDTDTPGNHYIDVIDDTEIPEQQYVNVIDDTDTPGHYIDVIDDTDIPGHHYIDVIDDTDTPGHHYIDVIDDTDIPEQQYVNAIDDTDIPAHQYVNAIDDTDIPEQQYVNAIDDTDIPGHQYVNAIDDTDIPAHQYVNASDDTVDDQLYSDAL